MQYFYPLILAGLTLNFLPINAEFILEESFLDQELPSESEEVVADLEEESPFTDIASEIFSPQIFEDLASFPVEEMSPAIAAEQVLADLNLDDPIKIEENSLLEQVEMQPVIESPFEATEVLPVIHDVPPMMETFSDREADSLSFTDSLPFIDSSVSFEALSNEISSEPISISDENNVILTPSKQLALHAEGPISEQKAASFQGIALNLEEAFSGAPIIYSLLLIMSLFSVFIWIYSIYSMRAATRISTAFLSNVQNKLGSNHFEDALSLCQEKEGVFSKMLLSGIHTRRHGLPVMIEAMKAEGKRTTVAFWQRIGLLNDIAIIAPMVGLLGTVLGMFYAFYDVNRSMESISALFDGLGVSVGTTVAGIIVAILALILHSTAKYRLVTALTHVENKAQSLAVFIDDRTSIHRG